MACVRCSLILEVTRRRYSVKRVGVYHREQMRMPASNPEKESLLAHKAQLRSCGSNRIRRASRKARNEMFLIIRTAPDTSESSQRGKRGSRKDPVGSDHSPRNRMVNFGQIAGQPRDILISVSFHRDGKDAVTPPLYSSVA